MKKLFLIVLALLFAVQIYAQNITATGTVKNADGLVLVGVSVTEKGLTNSTLTDIDGNFQLLLTSGKPIVISMKGYETQVVEVGPDGKVPDIILQKAAKRVSLGLMAGVDYGRSIIGNDKSEYNKIKSSSDFGYNFGILINIKSKKIYKNKVNKWSNELGFRFYIKNEFFPEYDMDTKVVYLNVPLLISTWKSGVNKGFIITGGIGVNVLLKGEVPNLMNKEFKFGKVGFAGNYGFGYEFSSGLGIRLTGNVCFLIAPSKKENTFNYLEGLGDCVLTYRF